MSIPKNSIRASNAELHT